jgi:polar amino acid transport system substrate-binding protein
MHTPRPTTSGRRRARLVPAVLLLSAVGLAACGSDSEPAGETTVAEAPAETTPAETTPAETTPADTTPAETTPAETVAATETTAAPAAETTAGAAAGALAAECAPDQLATKTAGTLTIGTDKPAFPPWFSDDDPTNGKGFESAVAYAVAETLGYSKDQVKWITVPFNNAFAPGKKDFDFDINQVSIKEERKAAVDFSDGYYEVNQAVVAFEDSAIAAAKTVAELKDAKLGAQVGTTSLDFIKNVVQPTSEPLVYDTNNDAKAAMTAKQIDGIVLDLPTAFYVSAVEIEGSKVLGQFASQPGGEQFGLVLEKGNPVLPCVNQAIASLKSSGKLAAIQQAELSDAVSAPVFQ